MKLSTRLRLDRILVWSCRLIVGITFIISGWSKAIDPRGFIIKVGEYLQAWDWTVPEEAIVAGCAALAAIEFAIGILISTGCFKRVAVWMATAMMAFLLPLTLYIYIANPVADCGCFGDLWQISNGATFAKNVLLAALIGYLIVYNRRVRGIYPAAIQWLVVTVSLAFPLSLSFVGYQVQPVVDFRPYKTGSLIFTDSNSGEEAEPVYVYERNGETRRFSLDEVPDSTWTYVSTEGGEEDGFGGDIEIRDSYGDDCSDIIPDLDGPQLFLIIPEPGMHYLSYAHYVTRLAESAKANGIEFIGITGGGDEARDRLMDWCRPEFDVYSADAVSLKQMVRGKEAIIYTNGGRIIWKRTLSSLPPELAEDCTTAALDSISVPDSGSWHLAICITYILSLLLIYLLSLSPKILRFFVNLRHNP